MSKKVWSKGEEPDKRIEMFTVGNDQFLDSVLAPYDILGSLAHAKMLFSAGLLNQTEHDNLTHELLYLYKKVIKPGFSLPKDVEDIHSWVELVLTEKLGDTGKKIHTGRSRNDQVLVDLKMYIRDQIKDIIHNANGLFKLLINLSEKYKEVAMPGYTHMQVAMPSSFGLWFGAYAESLVDDVLLLQPAFKIANKNPLGSAAGYGSSFPLNRTITTELLGFESLNYNSIYAQMNRGKTERVVTQALTGLASTLGKLALDCVLYMGQNFGFISFPDNLTTGSSIMPHKKNPDVLEIIRGRCNQLLSLPNEITMISQNLPSGYHRDLQITKERLIPAFENMKNCLQMMMLMLENVEVKRDILDDPIYRNIYSVELVDQLTQSGMTFRDAYRKISADIESGLINRPKDANYTHQGSTGNLCTKEIKSAMEDALQEYNFDQYQIAISKLLSSD